MQRVILWKLAYFYPNCSSLYQQLDRKTEKKNIFSWDFIRKSQQIQAIIHSHGKRYERQLSRQQCCRYGKFYQNSAFLLIDILATSNT